MALPGGNYDETYYQNLFTSEWGAAAGSAYEKYNAANSSRSAATNANDFAELVAVEGLDKAIATAVTGAATVEGAVPGAIASGAEAVYAQLRRPRRPDRQGRDVLR